LDGPVTGSHRVEIEATDYLGFAIDDESAFAAAKKDKHTQLTRNPVPEIYNRKSTLVAEITTEGSKPLQFDLLSTSGR
jgi:hypothetical protein